MKNNLCGLTADEIFGLIGPLGFGYAHAVSISNGIYKKRASDLSQIVKIPGKLLEWLNVNCFAGIYLPHASEISADGTVKYLFRSESGKEFETVFIPDIKRNTVCVSTQAGCRMGCSFCVTGRYGFHGNLSAGDIVNQVIGIPGAEEVTHIVFMGMGEPMDNVLNVLKACEILTAEWGLSVSPRNVTVSTVGLMPGVVKFLFQSDCNMTFSLLSPFSEERKMVTAVENKYPAEDILEILKSYRVKKKRRLSVAYVMIKDFNDSDKHLEKLKGMIGGSSIRVNLLPYHPAFNDPFSSSSEERMQYFKHSLVVSGISASIRRSRGVDISAACGLLATGLTGPSTDSY